MGDNKRSIQKNQTAEKQYGEKEYFIVLDGFHKREIKVRIRAAGSKKVGQLKVKKVPGFHVNRCGRCVN